MKLTSYISTGAVIARNPATVSPFVRLLLVLVFLLGGGTMLTAQTITRNVVAGGVLDLNPVSEVFPAGTWAWMQIRHTTVPGTTKGTMSKTMIADETVWGTTTGPNPFAPAASPTFTQNRLGGSTGFRYTSNGTGAGTSESIPIRFTNTTGSSFVDYTLVINIQPAGSGPQITTQPVPLQTVNPGTSATLTVVASGTGLTYQWYEGVPPSMQSPIAGATASSFATPVRPGGAVSLLGESAQCCGLGEQSGCHGERIQPADSSRGRSLYCWREKNDHAERSQQHRSRPGP